MNVVIADSVQIIEPAPHKQSFRQSFKQSFLLRASKWRTERLNSPGKPLRTVTGLAGVTLGLALMEASTGLAPAQAQSSPASRPQAASAQKRISAQKGTGAHKDNGAQKVSNAEIVANIDKLLAKAKPGDKTVRLGDVGYGVKWLRAHRNSLAGQGSGGIQTRGFVAQLPTWTNGVVPYAFHPNVTQYQKDQFLFGARKWLSAANISFVARTDQVNYLYIAPDPNINWSDHGMQGSKQTLGMKDWEYIYIAAHEVGHALGLVHEHQRSDRNTYIEVHTENASDPSQFTIINGPTHGAYDLDSVMHYGTDFLSHNNQPTIIQKPGHTSPVIGQQTHLSVGDKAAMASIYGASPDPTPPTLSLTSHSNGQAFPSFENVTFSGTVSDGGTGVNRVEVAVAGADGRIWDGSAWEHPDTLRTFRTKYGVSTVVSGGTWSCSANLPSDGFTSEGAYTVEVHAFDQRENESITTITVTIDRTAPTAALSTPANGAYLNSLPAISGTSADSGSGVQQIWLLVYQDSTDKYWNGTAWVTPVTYLTATPAGNGNWSISSILPGGANLSDGIYQIAALAKDKAGNFSSYTIGVNYYSINIDKTAPGVSVTNPAPNGAVKSLSGGINGTSTDAAGLNKTTVELFRSASGGGYEYWNGSAWVASSTDTVFTITHTGNPTSANWAASQGKNGSNVSFTAPSGANLPDGNIYRVRAKAYDRANNITVVTTLFAVDNTTPALAVTTPAPSGAVKTLSAGLGGTSSDAVGLDKVTVELFRSASGGGYEYWNGSAWISTTTVFTIDLPTAPTSANWNTSQNPAIVLPGGANLPDGNIYRVRAKAYDLAGNVTVVTTLFAVDNGPPTVTITDPVNAPTRATIGPVTGTASDSVGGLNYVSVLVSRPATGGGYEYWNGTSWGASGTLPPLTPGSPSGTFNWSVPIGQLPTGANLPDGNYYVRAIAYDRAGNTASTATQLVIIDADGS